MHIHTDPDPHKDTVKKQPHPPQNCCTAQICSLLRTIKRDTVLNTLSRRSVKDVEEAVSIWAQLKILL